MNLRQKVIVGTSSIYSKYGLKTPKYGLDSFSQKENDLEERVNETWRNVTTNWSFSFEGAQFAVEMHF